MNAVTKERGKKEKKTILNGSDRKLLAIKKLNIYIFGYVSNLLLKYVK